MNEAIQSVLDSPELPYGAIRRVAVNALVPFGADALPVIEKKIVELTPTATDGKGDWDKRKRAEAGIEALRHAAVRIALIAKQPLSDAHRKTLTEELDSALDRDLDVLQGTVALTDDQTRASLFAGEFRPKDYRPVLQLAYLFPATLPKVIAATAQLELGKYDDQ